MENPSYKRQIIKGLKQDFGTSIYSAAFLAYLIDTFYDHGFNFQTPQTIVDDSRHYIKENNIHMSFIEEAFDQTDDVTDIVLLVEAYQLYKDLNFANQLGIKTSSQLYQRMRMKLSHSEPIKNQLPSAHVLLV